MPDSTSFDLFVPHPFPPRYLKRKRYAPLLKQANVAMKQFKESLETSSPLSRQVYETLLATEVLSSVESQLMHAIAFEPIHDYLKGLEYASCSIIKTPLSPELLCKIHRKVKKSTAPKSDLGKFRTRQNWIGPMGCDRAGAYFHPPAFKKVKRLMEELFRYIKKNEEEPLLQLGLVFAQLLIIHPFMDGNGRIARILIPLFLYEKKVLPIPFFFLSRYFKTHRLKYFQTLFETTEEKRWEDWICFFLKGIIQTSREFKRNLEK